jgi:hypothetical protein
MTYFASGRLIRVASKVAPGTARGAAEGGGRECAPALPPTFSRSFFGGGLMGLLALLETTYIFAV